MQFMSLADMPRGMPPRQRLILTVLAHHEVCHYNDLEGSTGISRRSLQNHCQQLEAQGYIQRDYTLTDSGVRVLSRIRLADNPAPAPEPPPRPPDCDVGKCRPPAAAAFKAYHTSGRVYHICAGCGDSLAIPQGKRHKLDGAAGF